MLTLKELWSKEAFKDLELKNYVDIDDTPESHHCEKVEEKLLRLEELLNLISDQTTMPDRDPVFVILDYINMLQLGFRLSCKYEGKSSESIKKGSLTIELQPEINPYITYDTAIRMVVDYYYYDATKISMIKGISIYDYIEYELEKNNYGLDENVLFDLINGSYFSSDNYKTSTSVSKYASNILEFAIGYCKFEDTSILKTDLPVIDLIKHARALIIKVIKTRHKNQTTDSVLQSLNKKYNAVVTIISAIFIDNAILANTDPQLREENIRKYLDSLDLLYKGYDLPEEYKFASIYEKSERSKRDLMRIFMVLSENNRQIFDYIEKMMFNKGEE